MNALNTVPEHLIPEWWVSLLILIAITVAIILYVRFKGDEKESEHPWQKFVDQEEFTLHDYQRYRWGHALQMLEHKETNDKGWAIHTTFGFGRSVEPGDVLVLKTGALLICEIEYKSNPKDMFYATGISVVKDVVVKNGNYNINSLFI